MFTRVINQKSKGGGIRRYLQVVRSYRPAGGGKPRIEVLWHVGPYDEQLERGLAAVLKGEYDPTVSAEGLAVTVHESLSYLPLAIVSAVFRRIGLSEIVASLAKTKARTAPFERVVEALVIQRCVAPASKLGFQRWKLDAAIEQVVGVPAAALHNSRVHRVLEELDSVKDELEQWLFDKGVREGSEVMYLDLTDTWFEHGGGSLARKGQTKEGIRCKRKIHIEMVVDKRGRPVSWRLLPGALNETTVLPVARERLRKLGLPRSTVLVFDRGMVSSSNLEALCDPETGNLFLTSVKSDSVLQYCQFSEEGRKALEELQGNDTDPAVRESALAKLVMKPVAGDTWAREVPTPAAGEKPDPIVSCSSRLRMYLYFNPEVKSTRRRGRQERIDKAMAAIEQLNQKLAAARNPRKKDIVAKQVTRILDRHSLNELLRIEVKEQPVQGKSKEIASFHVTASINESKQQEVSRLDGITLLVGHPDLQYSAAESVTAYRQKNAVEFGFRTIKSVLDLRPVYHHADAKIAAHVTLCILALLVERHIEEFLPVKIEEGDPDWKDVRSMAGLLERVDHVRLTRISSSRCERWVRTQERPEVEPLLKALSLERLLEVYQSKASMTFGQPGGNVKRKKGRAMEESGPS